MTVSSSPLTLEPSDVCITGTDSLNYSEDSFRLPSSYLTCFNLLLICCFTVTAGARGAEQSGSTNLYFCAWFFPPSSVLEIILNFNNPLGAVDLGN